MKRYIELINELRTQGYLVAIPTPQGMSVRLLKPNALEWDKIAEAQPFVFSPGPPVDVNDEAQAVIQKAETMGLDEAFDSGGAVTDIDAPFPVFAIEHEDGGPLDWHMGADKVRRETLGIIVVELSPRTYGFYTLTRSEGESGFRCYKSNAEVSTVAAFLKRIGREKLGVEVSSRAVKIGSGGEKRMHRIRKIVHVAPKTLIGDYTAKSSRQIDWTHRWEVRGHWRKHEGLGKNRDGEYCMHGYTWVVNYEKGGEDMPLVKKVRVVDGPVQVGHLRSVKDES